MDARHPWQLATPTEDGQFLLWPEPGQWVALARRTHEALAGERDACLLDVPLAEARQMAREQFSALDAARRAREGWPRAGAGVDKDALWFVTGHQTFPYHAGIWAKSVAAVAAARAARGAGQPGEAINLNVDHDLPHAGPQIAWPAVGDGGRLVRRGGLTLDHRQPFERQPAPTRQQLDELRRRLADDLAGVGADGLSDEAGAFFAGGSPADAPQSADGGVPSFAGWFTACRSRLDGRLGLELGEGLTSQLAGQDAFLLLACDVMARAGSFFAIYNGAVEEAAAATGHWPARPLEVSAGRLELPFWTLRPDRPGRGRLFVSDGQTLLLADSFGAIGAISRRQLRSAGGAVPALRGVLDDVGVQLRPRALTLTLFARVLLADLFVHGVGGGIYDHATDIVIRRHLAMEAMPFAVASATLRLPLNLPSVSPAALREARRLVRDLRFNPQRHLPPDRQRQEPASSLVTAKWSAVELNAALRSAAGPDQDMRRQQRSQAFQRIRQINRELAGLIEDRIAAEQAVARRLSEQARDAGVASARDYFYGLLPRAKLDELRKSIIKALAAAGAE